MEEEERMGGDALRKDGGTALLSTRSRTSSRPSSFLPFGCFAILNDFTFFLVLISTFTILHDWLRVTFLLDASGEELEMSRRSQSFDEGGKDFRRWSISGDVAVESRAVPPVLDVLLTR